MENQTLNNEVILSVDTHPDTYVAAVIEGAGSDFPEQGLRMKGLLFWVEIRAER